MSIRAGRHYLATASLVFGLCLSGAPCADEEERQQTEKKLQLVERLYQPLAAEDRSRALADKLAASRAALDAGEYQRSRQLSDELLRAMASLYAARKQSPSPQVMQRRYQRRMSEVESLRGAFLAIVEEKRIDANEVCNEDEYQRMLAEARSRADRGDYEAALELVEAMYDTMSVAVASLRDHETIEYRLVFNSPREEYEYELNRYRTHKLLLQMKLKEVQADEQRSAEARDKLIAADAAMEEARHLAAADQTQRAIELQEQAIALLVKALGILGMYLPK